ncbi:MAG: cell envelope integrity protein CreD [Bacteroidales bacterium]|nr:cell envelope integrity protein CreD [Bacteroidales bacterium]
MKKSTSMFIKGAVLAFIALLMLIPLFMVENQIRDRRRNAESCRAEVSQSWSNAQTLAGPAIIIQYDREEKDVDGKSTIKHMTETVFPKTLELGIDAAVRKLHRSIYDVMVYNSDVDAGGTFVLPAKLADLDVKGATFKMGISDLRGIEGNVGFKLGDMEGTFSEGTSGDGGSFIREAISLDRELMDGKTVLPFSLSFRTKGSENLMVKPYGELTEVKMHSDCPDPSFTGDFLPTERTVTTEGFDARWVVSQINRGAPDDTSFGVRMMQPVTQYQQSERAVKYAILIILLVFVAGMAVELISKKEINLVQYVVIGLSLVLFYALVLSFSEFISFPLAYAIAALMTTGALLGYFRGILKSREAWLLAGLVAVAYAVSYVLLQMQTIAFMAGTLILFAVLAAIMYLTRDLNFERTEG